MVHHDRKLVLATCFDTEAELLKKYGQAESNIARIKEGNGSVLYGVDATKMAQKQIRKPPLPPSPAERRHSNVRSGLGFDEEREVEPEERDLEKDDDDEFTGFSDDDDDSRGRGKGATLPSGPRGWDAIVFNFPHTGGLSTDVNRQTRHNQSLLVSFFKAALPLLTPPCKEHLAGGVILVTLFEGEPYTLWNIRDLGRHSGLRVERSWKFDWAAWPGYKHARTLGNVVGKDGKEGGGWKGEERSARTYAFVTKEAPEGVLRFGAGGGALHKKRQHEWSDEDVSD